MSIHGTNALRRAGVLVAALATSCGGSEIGTSRESAKLHQPAIEIPGSMKMEHAEIHEALIAATRKPGPVGEAARELAAILHPHFVREEQVALPPLGLLVPLSRGEEVAGMERILPMTDALRAELPEMLRQHQDIGAAARHLGDVARAERDAEVEELARELQLHARTEEEVFYPAAILVGDLVRARLNRR